MLRKAIAAGTALLAFAALSACSSSDDSATDPSVGGTAVCDDASITTAMTDLLASQTGGNELFRVDGLTCADGWSVVFPTIGAAEAESYTYTQVFQAEGQFWIPKDRSVVCGTINLDDQTMYPADATVPESLFDQACNTN